MSVALTCVSGALFALNTTVARMVLDRTRVRTDVAAVATVATAAGVALVIAAISGVRPNDLTWVDSRGFLLIGAMVPGVAQLTLYAAVRMVGPSRTAAMLGTVPVWAVVLAIVFLDERWSVSIATGTLLTAVGGVFLARERNLQGTASRVGLALAVLTAFQFAVRDVLARSVTQDSNLNSVAAAAVILVSGAIVLLVAAIGAAGPRTFIENMLRSMPAMLLPGVAVGLALPALLAAFERSRVGVVSPLHNASQSVAVVLLSGVLIGGAEANRRVVVALGFTLLGGTIIGITR